MVVESRHDLEGDLHRPTPVAQVAQRSHLEVQDWHELHGFESAVQTY